MKAAVWTEIGVMEIREVDIPKPKPGQALIKVHAAGVCVTDYHVYTGKLAYGKPPHIMGHEIAGEVVECNGISNPRIKVGTRVAIETYVDCGECEYCLRGERHLCVKGEEIGTAPHQGGYAQYICADIRNLVPLPDAVTYDEAGILEAVACPAGALYRIGVPMGSTVIVFGVGAAGLGFIQVARAMGAGKVIAVARDEQKLQRAKRFGATDTLNSAGIGNDELLRRLAIETEGKAHLSIEATGAPEMITTAVYAAGRAGHVVLYGLPESNAQMRFPVEQIVLNQLHVHGVTGYPPVWEPLVKMVESGAIDLKDMVTYSMPLDKIHEAFRLIEERDANLIKTVIHPWE